MIQRDIPASCRRNQHSRIARAAASGGVLACIFLLPAAAMAAAQEVAASALRQQYASAGEEALRAGDYRNALRLLNSEFENAEEGTPERFRAGLTLAKAYAASGDVAAARSLEKSLRPEAKTPADKARLGLLQASMLIGEGKNEEAAAIILPANAPDELKMELFELRIAGLTAYRRFDAALKACDEAEAAMKGKMQNRIRLMRAGVLLMAGNQTEAVQILAAVERDSPEPALAATLRKLRLLQAVMEKKVSEVREMADALIKANGGSPDALLFGILMLAADNCEFEKNNSEAIRLLNSASYLAATPADMRSALRRLANLCLIEGKYERASAATELMMSTYPAQSSEYGELRLQAARLRAEAGQPKAAAAHYEALLRDSGLPAAQKLAAARESASFYFTQGEPAKANAMLLYIIENGETPDERQEGNFLLGEAAYRNGDYRAAAEYFGKSATSGKWHDRSLFWTIQSLLRTGEYVSALDAAELLSASKDADFAASGSYYRALLLEKSRRTADALAAYRKFCTDYPKSSYVRDARFGSARLAAESGLYNEAVVLFENFGDEYKTDPAAASAYYRAAGAAFASGDRIAMNRVLEKLLAAFPESEYASSAVFLEVDALCGEHREEDALALLQRLEVLQPKPDADTAAQLRYDRARILNLRRKQYEALQILENLVTLYPAALRCADAFFLAGNIHSELGEYAKAAESYRRAAALRPGGGFAVICEGRIADASFSAAALKNDEKQLAAALAIYDKLSKDADPLIAVQSRYKIGRCYELAGEQEKALSVYDELLYDAVASRRDGKAFPAEWAGKAAYAACAIYLSDGTMASAHEALRVLRLFRMLKLDTGEDFDAMERKIRDKYKI